MAHSDARARVFAFAHTPARLCACAHALHALVHVLVQASIAPVPWRNCYYKLSYLGHNYVDRNYVGYSYTGHSYIGHNYTGHNYIGHSYTCNGYIGHNYLICA